MLISGLFDEDELYAMLLLVFEHVSRHRNDECKVCRLYKAIVSESVNMAYILGAKKAFDAIDEIITKDVFIGEN